MILLCFQFFRVQGRGASQGARARARASCGGRKTQDETSSEKSPQKCHSIRPCHAECVRSSFNALNALNALKEFTQFSQELVFPFLFFFSFLAAALISCL